MPENIDPDVALSIIRKLSGTENYPFHPEGEAHLAEVLLKNCAGVSHARLVIEEFDEAERCPTVEALRAAARRLAEVCECGKAKWQHREGGACRRFSANPLPEDDELTKTPTGYTKFRQSVPLVSGVPWEVCLQVESMRIDMGTKGSPPDNERLIRDYEHYPEAMESLRLGQEPDYKLLEAQMRARHPHMWKGSRKLAEVLTADRLASIDKKYAVESIPEDSVQ